MRLLFLTEYFAPDVGGTAVYYYEVLRRLPRMEITVITRAHPDAKAFDRRQPFTIVRTPFPPIPKVRVVVEWWAHFLTGLWLVLRRRIDVVHGGQVFPLGLAVYGIHLLTRVPYALYIHGEDITIGGRRWWKRTLIAFLLRRAAAVFANSRFSANQASALRVPEHRIHIACPGVDHNRFRPMEGSIFRTRLGDGSRRVLLSTASLIPRKGQDTIIRLLPNIAAAIPEAVYWVVGRGSRSERQRLEELANTAGVADRVRFLGEVSHEDLPGLFAACDIFVMLNRTMPNGDVEGFGIVFLEAGASGKPVVGGRSGGAVEAVKAGHTGFLIPEGDDSAAISAIVRLLSDTKLRARLGEAGRRRAIRHFSWDRTAHRVAKITTGLGRQSEVSSDVAFREISRDGNRIQRKPYQHLRRKGPDTASSAAPTRWGGL